MQWGLPRIRASIVSVPEMTGRRIFNGSVLEKSRDCARRRLRECARCCEAEIAICLWGGLCRRIL